MSSDHHFETIVRLCNAAKKKSIEVILFLTHKGILLTQDPGFTALDDVKFSVCKVGFERLGLNPSESGIQAKDYTTQAMHAEMINTCDRYVVF